MSDDEITVKVIAINTQNIARIYSNYFVVSNTPYDFTLDCCDIPPILEMDLGKAKQENVVAAPIKARIVVPLEVMPNLIKAMSDTYTRYLENVKRKGEK